MKQQSTYGSPLAEPSPEFDRRRTEDLPIDEFVAKGTLLITLFLGMAGAIFLVALLTTTL